MRLGPLFGKVLFSVLDLSVAYFTQLILARRRCSDAQICLALALWLLNPLAINVSTRGNAESVVAALVLASLAAFHSNRLSLAAVL
jgi:phosphatidylinositol glycan class M